MATYYCNQCSKKNGMLHSVDPNLNFTGSFASKPMPDYLSEKFFKHTRWPQKSSGEVVSVYYFCDYDSYRDNNINTFVSGSIEDDKGKVNVIWISPSNIGFAVKNNIVIEHHNAIKLVLHRDVYKIHSFSTGSQGLLNKLCAQCGNHAF